MKSSQTRYSHQSTAGHYSCQRRTIPDYNTERSNQNAHDHYESPLVSIDVPLLDHAIISRLVSSPTLDQELRVINNMLTQSLSGDIQIYTDGSLY